MALDYSKLTTAELEAIANDDFSKLSTRTLRALANEPEPKTIKDNVKDFGKATASLADTALNAVTGTLDYAAYPLARAFGRSPEQATQETTSPKDVVGRMFGITQDPAYQNEASRRLMAGVGQGVENYAVKPLASVTGLPEQDVGSMVGSAGLFAGVKAQPYVNRAGQKVAQGMYAAEPYIAEAIKAPIKAPIQFGKGVIEGLVNKEYNPATSAMVPLRETYTPPAAAERFMGQLPGVPQQSLSQLQSQARPTSELVGGTAGRIAQAISPKTLQGETLVPLQGQGMQAFGERVGRGVRTNPLQAMGEVGLTALTGIPFKTLAQGVGEVGASYLGAKTGFMPGFSQQLGQAQGRAGIQSQMPQTPLLTNQPSVAGPIKPNTMFVSPEGVAGTNINQVSQMGAQQKYAPQPVPQSPAQQSQQMAAQKLQEIQQNVPLQQQVMAQGGKGADIIAQIRARQAAPVAPAIAETPATGSSLFDPATFNQMSDADKLSALRARVKENPQPQMTAADEASMRAQQVESQQATNSEIISQHAKGNIMGETTSLDTGKNAYNESKATQGKAKALEKAGVDSLPVVNGMSEAQVIDALHKEMFGKTNRNPPSITTIRKGQERLRREFEPIRKLEEEIQKLDPRTSKTIDNELKNIDEQMTILREDALESRLLPDTPEGEAYAKQLGEMGKQVTALEKELEAALKAEKKASKSSPKTLEEKVDTIKQQGETRRNKARGNPNVLEMKIDETGSKDFMTPKVDETGTSIYGSKNNPLTPDQYSKVKGWKILQGNDDPHIIYSKDKNGAIITEKIIPDEEVKVRIGTPQKPVITDAKSYIDDFLSQHADNMDASLSIWSKDKNGKVQNQNWDGWTKSAEIYDDYSKNPDSYTRYLKYEWNDREGEYVYEKQKIVNGQTVEQTIYSPNGEFKTLENAHENKKYKTDTDEYPDWTPSNINEWPEIFK